MLDGNLHDTETKGFQDDLSTEKNIWFRTELLDKHFQFDYP